MTTSDTPPLCEIPHTTTAEEEQCEQRRLATPADPLDRTITVGPTAIFFTNVNRAMNLRAHSHTGAVTVVYDTIGRHGYPSFADTNAALERHIPELTRAVFKDATNEDIADRLFVHLDGYVAPEWERWGGQYRPRALHLDVIGVRDQIGHDAGTTRYTVARTHHTELQPRGSSPSLTRFIGAGEGRDGLGRLERAVGHHDVPWAVEGHRGVRLMCAKHPRDRLPGG